LLPENATAIESDSSSDEDDSAFQATSTQSSSRPPPIQKQPPAKPRKSFAERLAKSQRDESMLPRVTAYCTCEAYKLVAAQKFLTEQHDVNGAVIYDEALYARYELPLRNGEGGFRVRSGEVKREDASREYSSDSETQVKRVNGDHEDDHTVGSSAMLDGQMSDENLFSPPREVTDAAVIRGVQFLEEEDQKAQQDQQQEMSPERTLKRRDSVPVDVNALSNLAERTLQTDVINFSSICVFLWRCGVLEFHRTSRKRYPSRLHFRQQFPPAISRWPPTFTININIQNPSFARLNPPFIPCLQ
jgi:uncharacterized Rmd1/YagE family protein